MKIFIFFTIVLSLSACSNNHSQIDEYLFNTANKATNAVERYKACILLSVLPPNDRIIEDIKNNRSDDSTCNRYLLAKYRIDQQFTDTFINTFPEKDALKPLWSIHSQSGYVMGILPPSIQLLTELAKQNDHALDKVVSAIQYSDGAFSESLTDSVTDIYIKMPSRVNASFTRVNLSEEEITLIIKTAEY